MESLSKISNQLLLLIRTYFKDDSLVEAIKQHYGYYKASFTKKQFTNFIHSHIRVFSYENIEILFGEMDKEGTNVITLKEFQIRLGQVQKKKYQKQSYCPEDAIQEVNNLLNQTSESLNLFFYFDKDKEGFLNQRNLNDLLDYLKFTDKKKKQIFIDAILQKEKSKSINCIIEKLSKQNLMKTAIILPQNKMLNSNVFQLQKKKQIQKQKIQIDLSNPNPLSEKQIPQLIRPYFNTESILQRQFAFLTYEYLKSKHKFLDEDQPTYSKAKKWKKITQFIGDNYKVFEIQQSVFLRSREGLGLYIEPKDIKQGNLGDCYFLSAAAATTQTYPNLLQRLFVLFENPSDIYGVRLFIDGVWKTIPVDIRFPVNEQGRLCAAQHHGNEIWVMILQKAWAKVFESYDAIVSGYTEEGLRAITGAPSMHLTQKEDKQKIIGRLLMELKQKKAVITCSCSNEVKKMSAERQAQIGLYSDHAYSLLDIYCLSPALTIIKLRNPWGNKGWKGDWSFDSPIFTPDIKAKVHFKVDPKDGTFFMSDKDFLHYFSNYSFCNINEKYVNSYIEIEGERSTFNNCKFRVKTGGRYFITIYQQSKRKMRKYKQYDLSKSWLFLIKSVGGDKYQAIGSHAEINKQNTIECDLTPGDYIIVSKVAWEYWQTHAYNLTSYGPASINFVLEKEDSLAYLRHYITSMAHMKLGEVHEYYVGIVGVRRYSFFSLQLGYGYLLIENANPKYHFRVTVKMNGYGFDLIPPNRFPVEVNLPFKSPPKVLCFYLDPKSYSRQINQQLNLTQI